MTADFSAFESHNGELHAEAVPLSQLAEQFGTPLYVYSRTAIEQKFDAYRRGLGKHPGLICYAVKANSNLAVLDTLVQRGAGFDIVSLGELERVLAAGGDPAKVVFSGVAKRAHEMQRALEVGIHCFNVESESELRRLNKVAGDLDVRAPVSLRVNPDVDAQTHPYISTGLKQNKFGIAIDRALEVYRLAAQDLPNLDLIGVDCHIGSQILNTSPFDDALDRVLALVSGEDIEPDVAAFVARLVEVLGDRDLELVLEPGRSIVANAGVLLTRVEYLKDNGDHHFAIVDAGMNDQIRPALYQAWMSIEPVTPNPDGQQADWDIVGPVCETGDFLGKGRPLALAENDLLAVHSAGAYGSVMASNYNSRNRPAEVMVAGDQVQLVRKRETIADQLALESRLS